MNPSANLVLNRCVNAVMLTACLALVQAALYVKGETVTTQPSPSDPLTIAEEVRSGSLKRNRILLVY